MFAREELSDEEAALFGKCGIFCGACDMHIGEARRHAKRMYEILESLNFEDVGPLIFGADQKSFEAFKELLARFANSRDCGCCATGGPPMCPIKSCAAEKGFLTCAECDSLEECTDPSKPNTWNLARKEDFFKIISIRYNNWNLENLKEIREHGYRRFLDTMKEKVEKGFRTGDVISKEKVFQKAVEKMRKGT